MQYFFEQEERTVENSAPHGNSKRKQPYHRLLCSTQDKLKQSTGRFKNSKGVLDEIYSSSGDVYDARSLSHLPRGPREIYKARDTAKKRFKSSTWNSRVKGQDEVWVILEKTKKEVKFSEQKFIRDFRVHPSFSVVLSLERQLDDVVNFCTNPEEVIVFSIDPTFNIFNDNINLTVTAYRSLKLENLSTGQAPAFLGPLLMHQKKD